MVGDPAFDTLGWPILSVATHELELWEGRAGQKALTTDHSHRLKRDLSTTPPTDRALGAYRPAIVPAGPTPPGAR